MRTIARCAWRSTGIATTPGEWNAVAMLSAVAVFGASPGNATIRSVPFIQNGATVVESRAVEARRRQLGAAMR
jgi:hypothetical protein